MLFVYNWMTFPVKEKNPALPMYYNFSSIPDGYENV